MDGCDEVGFGRVGLGEVAEDAEAVDDAGGVQLDGAGVVPLLQLADGVGAGEAAGGGGGVDVSTVGLR